jgi:hypothetical protein
MTPLRRDDDRPYREALKVVGLSLFFVGIVIVGWLFMAVALIVSGQ